MWSPSWRPCQPVRSVRPAGASTGAAVGAAVGNANGSTAKGAIIGAAVGGTAGAVIGHQMDQQAKELSQNIKGATVERVGEGIKIRIVLCRIDSVS